MKWPPAMVYGITPQTSSGKDGHRQYIETPPVLGSPKVKSPALFTSAISAFVVPAKKARYPESESNKEYISGRAAFEEPLVRG